MIRTMCITMKGRMIYRSAPEGGHSWQFCDDPYQEQQTGIEHLAGNLFMRAP